MLIFFLHCAEAVWFRVFLFVCFVFLLIVSKQWVAKIWKTC